MSERGLGSRVYLYLDHKRRRDWVRLAIAWGSAGIGFNLAQRVLDFVLDDVFRHVSWLAWLAG